MIINESKFSETHELFVVTLIFKIVDIVCKYVASVEVRSLKGTHSKLDWIYKRWAINALTFEVFMFDCTKRLCWLAVYNSGVGHTCTSSSSKATKKYLLGYRDRNRKRKGKKRRWRWIFRDIIYCCNITIVIWAVAQEDDTTSQSGRQADQTLVVAERAAAF